MTRPAEWKGSDLRSRTEVVRYLAERGGKITDKSGLIVGNMARELGRGRALSQLLQDMEKDGMIRREVRGRRTFELSLLDDWGLVPRAVTEISPATHDEPMSVPDGVDYNLLAESLLAITLKRASQPQPAPEQADGRLTARLKQAEKTLSQANQQCADLKAERDAALAEAKEMREKVEILTHNQEVLQQQLTARPTKREGVSIADRLSNEERAMLSSLMTALPESADSKKREPKRRTR